MTDVRGLVRRLSARDDKTDDPLRSIQLLWGEDPPGRRGPKARLSVAKIAKAAIALADADGLAAVSMQRVAAELGYTTMSLYNHIPGKSLLLEVMMDSVVVAPARESVDPEHWRAAVLQWAGDMWQVFMAHPWVLRIQLDHSPMGPNQLGWLERLLAALSAGSLPPSEAMSTAMYILTALRGMAQLAVDLPGDEPTADSGPRNPAPHEAALASLITPERFPHLAAANAAKPIDPPPTSAATALPADIHFGINRLLDGVEAYLAEVESRP